MTNRERHADLARRAVALAERTAHMSPVQVACHAMGEMTPEAQLEICAFTLFKLTGIGDPEELTLRQEPAFALYEKLGEAVMEKRHSYADMLLFAGVVVQAIRIRLREEMP